LKNNINKQQLLLQPTDILNTQINKNRAREVKSSYLSSGMPEAAMGYGVVELNGREGQLVARDQLLQERHFGYKNSTNRNKTEQCR